MDYKIMEERMNICSDIDNINRHKIDASAYSVLATIRDINLQEFTCTVFVPSSSTLIHGVVIANSPFSDNSVGLNMVPTIGQKCIVLLCQQHNPILVSTIPNTLKENEGKLLNGEYKLGDNSAFMKQNVAGDLLLKTSATIEVKDENGSSNYSKTFKFKDNAFDLNLSRTNGISSMEETFYKTKIKKVFKKKDEIIKNNILDESLIATIETELNKTVDRALDFFAKIEGINSIVESNGIGAISEMKAYVLDEDIDKNTFLNVQKGDSEENTLNNLIYSMKYVEAGNEMFNMKCKKNGVIEISCKDFVVNKTTGQQ